MLGLLVLSVALSVVPALKTEVESAVINEINDNLGKGGSFTDALHSPVEQLSTDEGGIEGFVLRIASTFFSDATLLQAAVSYGIITVLAAFLVYLSTVFRARLERDFFTELRSRAMETLMDPSASALPLQEGDEKGITVQQGAVNVAGAYTGMLEVVQYAFALVVTTLLLLSRDVRLAAAIVIVVVLQTLLTYIKTRRLQEDRRQLEQERDLVVRRSDDIIENRDFIAAHEQRQRFHDVLQQLATTYGKIEQRLSRRDQAYRGVTGVLGDAGRLAILFVALAIATGAVGDPGDVSNIGDAYFLIAIYVRMLNPTQGILGVWDGYRRQRDVSERFRALLAARDELPQSPPAPKPDVEPVAATGPAARFEDVRYAYQTANGPKTALDGCSFEIPRGQTTLIVGRSGSGKTTLARMLLGFLHPDGGAVQVLGQELGAWNHPELLREMSYLPQADYVIEDTVRVNLFAPDKDDHELSQALSTVEVDAALESDATRLSTGEQQRVGLARLLLDDAELVLMDEPLSGVDAFTFAELSSKLAAYLADERRTCVVISHRLSFISQAEHVVLLEAGRVIEEGATGELLADPNSRLSGLLAAARSELGR
ncbi:ATP-binding cassette domain-containing protein [Solirubrobacter soli]|uniref:ATP-binding cassette domain-containing protein n=1 Tax=Solirubrobacter soli TaxID=363832 RepID=UPI00040C55D1|nr:ABC transporter ATP-binding protein [Solirubrobacter soli]